MEDYLIISWPEIQFYSEEEGFSDNATLINENSYMDIGPDTWLVDKDWATLVEERCKNK